MSDRNGNPRQPEELEQPERLSKYWVREEPNPIAQKGIRDWVEEQIQTAISRGAFQNLPGKGKPLRLGSEHPWEEQDWMANHVLANAHVVQLNQKIGRCNLLVPAGWMQKARYRD